MHRVLLMSVIAVLALVLADATDVLAQQISVEPAFDPSCLAERRPPQLFSGEVVGPQTLTADDREPFGWNPAFGRLSRGGVHYVSANYVRVQLVADRCALVSAVRVGS